MAASQRYTGANLVLVIGSTTISGDYTKFDIAQTVKLEARTAANDTSESFNPLYKQGSGTFTFFDNGSAGNLLNFLNGLLLSNVSLTVYPQGIGAVGSGLPVFQLPILIEEIKIPFAFDKNIMLEVKYKKNGDFTKAFGSTQ